VTGAVKLACRAAQALHTAGEAREYRKIAATAKRIRRKNILAAFKDKLSYKTL
jgi:hypothetical protein